jgi:biofilm PGA synthesis N-glycosyltransferase PgaC
MIPYLPLIIVFALFGFVAILGFVDKSKKRPFAGLPPLSFMVPCYNDADSVSKTLDSIYSVCGPDIDVVVIDDASTDGSQNQLMALSERYGFNLILNSSNLGKSKTLNEYFHLTKNDIVVFVDADVIVNQQSLVDSISRLQCIDVGAVSCPYRSANSGFIPTMQTIEYNMLAFIQGAYNVFSAIALWGGFITIKRKAFMEAGGFTLNAITEDKDLAFKLNEIGWRVEQSFCPIRTYVPDTFSKWFKQKLRWNSGGFQCFVRYYRVWLKNPLQILFVFSFSIFLIISTLNIGKNLHLWDETVSYFVRLHQSESVWLSLQLTSMKFGVSMLKDFSWRIVYTLFSLPFVLPLVSTVNRIYFCFLIIPFSIFYIPLLSSISIIGAIYFLQKSRLLHKAIRAW